MSRFRRRYTIKGLVGLNLMIALSLGLFGATPAGCVASIGIVAIYVIEERKSKDLLMILCILGFGVGLGVRTHPISIGKPIRQKTPPAAARLVADLLAEPRRSALAVGSSLEWAVAEFSPEMIEAIGGDVGRVGAGQD